MTTRGAAATVFAGAVQNQLAWLAGGGFPAVSSTVLTDLTQAQPVSVPGPALPTAKAYVSAVNLPDLTVLETGGGTARQTPVYEASIFNPSDRSIRPVAPNTVGRTYHSSAILLPDGSVATFGGDPGALNMDKSKKFELRIEIYQPDYFFKGPRPTISTAPVEVTYGGVYSIQASATHAKPQYGSAHAANVHNALDGPQSARRPSRLCANRGWRDDYHAFRPEYRSSGLVHVVRDRLARAAINGQVGTSKFQRGYSPVRNGE